MILNFEGIVLKVMVKLLCVFSVVWFLWTYAKDI